MTDFVVAEAVVLEATAALYDSRFARTSLFFLGIVIIAGGLFLGILEAIAFGLVTLGIGWYYAATVVPRHETELRTARGRLASTLERLGQNSRSYLCT